MATAPIYCTHKELKRVFPQLDEFDNKVPVYGWTQLFTHSGYELYESFDSGLVTTLFKDGEDLAPYQKVESYSDSTANTDEAVDIIETAIDVTDGSVFGYGDIVKIDDEKMLVTNISSNTITVKRGFLGTTAVTHNTGVDVYIGVEWSEENQWLYNSGCNSLLFYSESVNPSDVLIEAGEDFTSLVTQFRTDASRYLDSKLDPNLPANQFKDKSGNFDYMIIRTTALLCATLMIRATDPTSEMATAYMTEAQENIDALNNGKAGLSWQNTSDSSKGVVRDVTYTGTVRPVDTRGHYSGTFDLLKIKITTAGAIGTAKYSVWSKDGDKLGMNEGNEIVTDEIINGDYQALTGSLQIRFSGTDFNSTAALNDIWEVEVQGWSEEVDAGSLKPIRMTRRYQ